MTNSQAASTGVDIDPNEFQKMSTALKIVETLARMDHRVVTLESAVRQNSAHIDQLRQKALAIPYLKRDVSEIKKNLSQLGASHNLEVNGLKLALEKGLNETAQSIRKEISALKDGDIKKLNHYAAIGRFICIIVGALITGGVLAKFLWH